ncbi:MAG: hypothetical protein LUH14_10730 [Clostridiaceae bacterium]|nr:hypothetical protein [Clostridiaceae bacterium]
MCDIILVDCSGSMAEMGKGSVVKYVLLAVQRTMESEFPAQDYKILLWNDSLEEYTPGSFPRFLFSGKTEADVLQPVLAEVQNRNLLLISDGEYTDECKKVLKNAREEAWVLMIGADCNKARLQSTFYKDRIYAVEDVVTCVRDFCQS